MGNKASNIRERYGMLRVMVYSKNLEKFINLLWEKGIVLKNIIRESINSVSFEIKIDDYETLVQVSKKTKSKFKIMNRKGIFFLKIKLKKRKSMVFGILLCIVIIYFLSHYIWGIQIVTEKNIVPYEVREELSSIGIKPGIFKGNIKVYDIEENLKKINPNIMWVRVRIEGSILKVTIREKESLPEIKKDNTANNIVAKKDGVVKRIYTRSGTAVVKNGEVVKKGQVLIIGEQGIEKSSYKVPAEGEVIATTYYEEERKVPLNYIKKVRTGRSITNYFIYVFGKKFYLKNSLNKFVKYDKIEKDDGFIKKEIYYEYKEETVKQNTNDLINKTSKAIFQSMSLKLSKEVAIVGKSVESNIEGNDCKVRVLITAEEDIGDVQK